MATTTVYFRGTRRQLRTLLNQLPAKAASSVIVGTNVAYAPMVHKLRPLWPPPRTWPTAWWDRILDVAQTGMAKLTEAVITADGSVGALVQGFQMRIATEALSFIREAFIVKSRGGTDEAGQSWRPLSLKYLIYGRRHPGRNFPHTSSTPPTRGRLAVAQWGEGRARRPMLTQKLDAKWRAIFGALVRKGLNAAIAARIAWASVKALGGRTVWAAYSPPPAVEINRDTGVLFNSLSPGIEGNVIRIEHA